MWLRPILEEFCVKMYEDTREHEVSMGLDALHGRIRVQCDNSNMSVLITITTSQV